MGKLWALSSSRPAPRLLRLVLASLLIFSGTACAQQAWQAEWPRTDFNRHSVELSEIVSGGPPRDGIPAIDQPRFITIEGATIWLGAKEPVVMLEIDGDARAYPLQILIWHEIVNDTVGNTPVAVTFCPLCNASLTFDRRLEGQELDFGTTGKLRNSDLVMYDRQTESWWQQLDGEAIVGTLTGQRLTQLPSQIVSFQAFRTAFPDGKVLSRNTGHRREYGRNPYQGYDSTQDIPFLSNPRDARLSAKERVIGLRSGREVRLYPFSAFEHQAVINDRIGDLPVVLFSEHGTRSALDRGRIAESRLVRSTTAFERSAQGRTLEFEHRDGGIYDRQTFSRWNLLGQAVEGPLQGTTLQPAVGTISFAFAWLAFDPEVEIYEAPRPEPAQ